MIRMLLCLTGAAVYAFAGLHLTPVPPGCVQPKDTVALQSERGNEVHSVVVDMPQVISLQFASPDTWARLPAEAQPDEQSPGKPYCPKHSCLRVARTISTAVTAVEEIAE